LIYIIVRLFCVALLNSLLVYCAEIIGRQ